MPADDLAGGIALEALGAGIPARDMARRVEHVDRVVGDGVDQQPEARLVGERRVEWAALPVIRLVAHRFSWAQPSTPNIVGLRRFATVNRWETKDGTGHTIWELRKTLILLQRIDRGAAVPLVVS